MPYPLDGARLKVVRAQQHLDSLNTEIRKYLDSHPHEFPVDLDAGKIAVKPAIIKTDPPLELGCIFGDCIANLRASLDYVAWQIAVRYASVSPVPGGKKDRIYFPLASDLPAFNANRGSNFPPKYAIPAHVVNMVESVQPYHAGYEPLALLGRLVNADKHCMPLLAVASVSTASTEIIAHGTPIPECILETPGGTIIRVRGATKAALQQIPPEESPSGTTGKLYRLNWTATLNAPAPESPAPQTATVEVDGQTTIFVSLSDPLMPLEPIDRTLEKIVKCVANIIPMFDSVV